MVILSVNKVLESGGGGISCRYEGAEGLTPGGDGSGAVATANGSKGSSGAPGEGSGGCGPGKLPVDLPPKLLLLLL